MNKIRHFLGNHSVILTLALLTGLFMPESSQLTLSLVLPALFLAMTLTAMEIPSDYMRSHRFSVIPCVTGIVMNYVILGNFILILSTYFIHEETFWTGFVLVASVPPATAVIPLSRSLNGNEPHISAGVAGSYLGSLVITPMVALCILELHSTTVLKVLAAIATFILMPFLISRVLVLYGLAEKIKSVRGLIASWSYFLVFYSLVGVNHKIIVTRFASLLPVAFTACLTIFLLGFCIQWIGTSLRFDKAYLMNITLLGTLKDYGLAGVLALLFFNREEALPAVIAAVIMCLYLNWLHVKRRMT